MIRDLVIYLLKQGPYTGKGDIAVLCAYLGQLQKVRAALRDAKLTVSLDERDAEQLERLGEEQPREVFEDVQIAKHVSLPEGCWLFLSQLLEDQTRDRRYFPRRRSENCDCLSRQKLWRLRWQFPNWILEGHQQSQRRPVQSETWSIHPRKLLQSPS